MVEVVPRFSSSGGLLTDLPTLVEQVDLSLRLEIDRALEATKRVQVLDLTASTEGSPDLRTDTLASMRMEPSSMRPSTRGRDEMPRSSAT